jgi:hypothetical protein
MWRRYTFSSAAQPDRHRVMTHNAANKNNALLLLKTLP